MQNEPQSPFTFIGKGAMKVNGTDCLISSFVLHRKEESHAGLEHHEGEYIFKEFSFCVNNRFNFFSD